MLTKEPEKSNIQHTKPHTTPEAQIHNIKQQDHGDSNMQTTNLGAKIQETQSQLSECPTGCYLG